MRLTATTFGPLAPHLLDLVASARRHGVPLVLVGGLGLVLRRQWRQEEGALLLLEAVPPARATEDFDVLLTLEMLADEVQRQTLRTVLAEAGFVVEDRMRYLHFIKPGSGGPGRRDVKVDLLAPPVPAGRGPLKENDFRVGPRGAGEGNQLHGYRTPEAALWQGEPLQLPLEGPGSSGDEQTGLVQLPHPFMLVVMKLCAFRDAFEGRRSGGQPRFDAAAKHLQDAYTLVALLTSEEADEVIALARSTVHPVLQDVQETVRVLLADPQTPGTLLLRATLRPDDADLGTVLTLLHDAFL
jgi:hypothetical protein